MQVFLQDGSGLFYAGKDFRTADTSVASDFRDINIAALLAVAQGLSDPQVILNYLSPACRIALPVRPEWFPCEPPRRFTEVSTPHTSEPETGDTREPNLAAMPESMVILVVEDREDDILLIQRAFSASGVKTPLYVVRDGEEGMEYLLGIGKYSNRVEYPLPQLILLDLKMPKMGGLELLRWIRQQPGLKTLRVIVLTSSEDIFDINAAYEAGANSFLVKPLEFVNYPAMMNTLSKFWLRDSVPPVVERPEHASPGNIQSAGTEHP